ncbi:MAG: hypothetical protein KDA28_10050, partial [Phycisphaerales bacterium]|nr:hypothetical protein [Phycisphaerales bacterium]
FGEATERARVATALMEETTLERDRTLAAALPGMIRIDEARSITATDEGDPEATARRIRAMLIGEGGGARSAKEILGAARRQSNQSDMRLVLLWYELDAYHAWWELKHLLLGQDVDDEVKCAIDALLDEMAAIPGGERPALELRTVLPDKDCNGQDG